MFLHRAAFLNPPRLKKYLLIILLFAFISGSSQQRFALVVSKPFDSKLIEEIRCATFGMYRMIVDSIGEFEPVSNDAERTIGFIPKHNGYVGTIGLTDHGMFYGLDFFPEPLYGLTIENRCVVSDYLLGFADCMKHKSDYDRYLTHIVLHEAGHILGLEHCQNKRCIMYGYGRIENTHLCQKCKTLFYKMKW